MVEYHPTIKELPSYERPRERLRSSGASSLSNSELLAIVLGAGIRGENVISLATRLLAKFGGLVGLARASLGELCAEQGIGEARATQVKASLELGRRLISTTGEERPVVRSPQDVAAVLMPEMSHLDQEHLRVMLLNTKNQVVGIPEVYRGNVSSSVVRPSELFRDAVRDNCPAIIVVHNHPSGDPTPSSEDIKITEQIIEAGKMLDIEVLDHIVIGVHSFVSLKERGEAFK